MRLWSQGMCLLDTNLVIYGQFTWGVFDIKAKLVEQKQYEGEGEILRWVLYKKMFDFENATSPISMKTLDTLDSYSLVTWSGNQEDPSMVWRRNPFHTKVRFLLAGVVNGERWRPGSVVEWSQCGDNKCKADPGLPLWHRRKLHRSNVQVETKLELLEECTMKALSVSFEDGAWVKRRTFEENKEKVLMLEVSTRWALRWSKP